MSLLTSVIRSGTQGEQRLDETPRSSARSGIQSSPRIYCFEAPQTISAKFPHSPGSKSMVMPGPHLYGEAHAETSRGIAVLVCGLVLLTCLQLDHWPGGSSLALSSSGSSTVGLPRSAHDTSTACSNVSSPPRACESSALSGAASAVQWTNVTSDLGPGPSPRYDSSVAFDPTSGYEVLFGGTNAAGAIFRDTWTLSNGFWQNRTPAHLLTSTYPAGRYGAALAYDPNSSALILFGGHGATGPLNDTWEFKNGNWSPLPLTVLPSSRSFPSMADDPANGCLVLFGGRTPLRSLNDTWCFSRGDWTNITGSGSEPTPPSRYGSGMAAFPSVGGVLLFGGAHIAGGVSVELNDTWAFSSGGWTNVLPDVSPPARCYAGVTPAVNGSSVLMYGGTSASGAVLGDLWQYESGGWTNETGPSGPGPLSGADLATGSWSVGGIGLVALYGGANSEGASQNATWVLGSVPLSPAQVSAVPDSTDVGIPVNLSVTVFGGTPPYRYNWTELPPGCTTEQLAVLSCVPTTPGTEAVEVTVTDVDGHFVTSSTVDVQVNPRPTILKFLSNPDPAIVGQPLTLTVVETGGTPPFRFSFAGVPGCSAVNVSTASVQCVPNATGTMEVEVSLVDQVGVAAFLSNVTLSVVTAAATAPSPLADEIVVFTAFAGVSAVVVYWATVRSRRKTT